MDTARQTHARHTSMRRNIQIAGEIDWEMFETEKHH